MESNVSFFHLFFKRLRMDDEFKIDIRFGLSMQCFWAMILAGSYAIFYLTAGFHVLFYLMTFIFLSSLGLLIYCQKDGRYARGLICAGISIQSAFVHILITYYLGNCGTIFFVVSAMLIPHLYPLLKMRYTLALDVLHLVVINIAFWISLNVTPVSADQLGSMFRFFLSNIGFLVCLLELYINIFSVNTLSTVRESLVERVSMDAYLDALTGLGNRRMLSQQLNSLEKGADAPLCLALIDIDFFKKINDIHGHAAGDKTLVFLAESMKNLFRKSDLLIRWGGEEFLILFRYTDLVDAEILMERFRHQIQETPIVIDDITINISVTIGLGEHQTGTSLSDSIKKVDALLYQGKSQGRNRVVVDKSTESEGTVPALGNRQA